MSGAQHQILAARFEAPDAASRASASVRRTFVDKIGHTAALYVESDGIAKLVGLKDWGTGRAALLGGLVGIIGGSIGLLASSGIGALATKLRDVDSATDNSTPSAARSDPATQPSFSRSVQPAFRGRSNFLRHLEPKDCHRGGRPLDRQPRLRRPSHRHLSPAPHFPPVKPPS